MLPAASDPFRISNYPFVALDQSLDPSQLDDNGDIFIPREDFPSDEAYRIFTQEINPKDHHITSLEELITLLGPKVCGKVQHLDFVPFDFIFSSDRLFYWDEDSTSNEDETRWSILNRTLEDITSNFPNVRSISFQQPAPDIIPTIQSLDLSHPPEGPCIQDFIFLSKFTGLTNLNLSGCPITDLTPLRSLTNLKSLNLSNCEINDKDLESLTLLNELEELVLIDCPVSTVLAISALPKLKELNLAVCPISTLKHLSHLNSLELLNLDKCPKPLDLSPLTSLNSLNELSLASCVIESITPLIPLNLHFLDIRECEFKVFHAADFLFFQNLERVLVSVLMLPNEIIGKLLDRKIEVKIDYPLKWRVQRSPQDFA